MRASRSANLLGRAGQWAARAGLPLPAGGDWQAADGWLPAGLTLLLGGGLGAVLAEWARLRPGSLPVPDRLLPLALLLALAELAVAGAHALRPHGETAVWRWLTIAGAALGAVWCDPAGAHARLWIPWLFTAALLGLAMRAGETLAAALANPLRTLPRGDPLLGRGAVAQGQGLLGAHAAGPQLPADRVAGENPLWTAWRLVAEVWLLAAAAAAFGGPAPGYRAAAAAAALGGALLVAGANITVLRAWWASRRFSVDPRQIRSHWGLGMALAAGLTLLALVAPLPAGPLAPRAVAGLVRRWTGPGVRAVQSSPPAQTAPSLIPPSTVGANDPLLALIHFLVREFIGAIVALLAAIPVALPLAAAAGAIALLALRYPRHLRAALRRLSRLLLALVGFWRYLRLPRRMRAALERMGLLRPEGAAPRAPRLAGSPAERLWALLDRRAAVRAMYRRFLREMAAAGRARPEHLSPREYARTLANTPGGINELTSAYELARFSHHAPERRWVEMARRGLAAAARARRRPRGRGVRRRPAP